MCYDISLKISIREFLDFVPNVKAKKLVKFQPTYHQLGMSFNPWPVVVDEGDGPELDEFIWGPVPKILDTPDKLRMERQKYLNARSEKFLDGKSMWSAIRHQRCIVPITGFFEYRQIEQEKQTKKGPKTELVKVCYYISEGGKPFFIAGLWAKSMVPTKNPEGKWDYGTTTEAKTFNLATTEANSVLRQIHNSGDFAGRMPLILTEELAMEWINPDLDDAGIQRVTSYQAPNEVFTFHPVVSVRKAHENVQEILNAIEVPDLPPITVS
ncbi:SOS response-associated peptidase [Chitinophaga varians]|uniref:SOS response-associated peptidase n=1 Tax=Chitinophaga varians TaxID=2202339 RepID=UPI00165F5696|nr:SOS response-associated peptidase family protein [Chitinophaga varians]MBC9913203.1 SOS response-associated peptidase family protein [Chitinophaga varians]